MATQYEGGSTDVYIMASSNVMLVDARQYDSYAMEPWRQLERDRIGVFRNAVPAPEVRGVDVTAQRAAPEYGADGAVTPMPHVFPAVEVT